jgi:radical SAM protein with 4Fe4S-binding SPASM domain
MKSLADEFHTLGVCEVTLGGGEPLMRPDLLPFIDHLRQKEIEVELTTNAFLADRSLAKALNSLRLRHVDVSFDGATQSTFEYVRGPGTFKRACRGLRILCEEMECGVEMHVTGMKPNFPELPLLADLAASAGCRGIGFLKVRPLGRLREFPELLLSPSEFVEGVRRLEELCRERGIAAPADLQIEEMPGKDLFTNFGCVAGNATCWIDALGRVAACSYYQYLDRRFIAGSLKKRTLKDLWNSSAVLKRIRRLRGNSTCLECRYINACRAGCRILGKIYHGHINAPDPYCVIRPDDAIFRDHLNAMKARKD